MDEYRRQFEEYVRGNRISRSRRLTEIFENARKFVSKAALILG